MKRISLLLLPCLLTVLTVRADDATTEERLNKLSGQIADLQAGQEALRRQFDGLSHDLDAMREQLAKPTGNYAAVEDLNRLRDALKDVDQKRLQDAEKTRAELQRLGTLLAAGPASGKRGAGFHTAEHERAANDTPKEPDKGFGDYVIQNGDTLSLIVQAYHDKGIKLTTDQILKANPGLDPKRLRVGQKIWIPAPQ
jgi:nucleoid-associated protein YgaU